MRVAAPFVTNRTASVPRVLVLGVPNSAGPVTAVVLEVGGRGTDFLNPEVSRARGVFLWIPVSILSTC